MPAAPHDPDDTRASFDSTWREHGVALPAGVNDWTHTQEVHGGPEGDVVTTTVRAKGPTAAALKTAVRAKKPGNALTNVQEAEDRTGREYSATYVQERANATTADRLGSSKLISRRVEIAIDGTSPEGDERDFTVDLIPGYEPWFTKNPRAAITVTERIISRLRGTWSSLDEFKLEPQVGSVEGMHRQPGRQRGPSIALESAGITSDADVWRGEASYVYLASKIEPAAIAAIAGEQ